MKTYTSGEKSDRREIVAVSDVSLEIPENTIFGIIGKSGAGKSSLVRLISLLEQPDSGAIYYIYSQNNAEEGSKLAERPKEGSSLCYRRVDNLSKKELIAARRRIGMIFQNFNLFSSRTVGKNVAYPLEICGVPKYKIKRRVSEMLELVGLADRENAPISTLSGGQKQRVAIARALATNPDILFCDEATSALDPNTTRQILELIRDIQKKMNLTVVMITHQMEVVRDACEQVAVIDNGKVVECAPVKELFSNPKTEITREFIKNISKENPQSQADKNENIVTWSEKSGSYVFHFIGEATTKSVLSDMAKKFDISFTILGAGVTKVKDENVGYMELDLEGKDEEISRAIDWLQENKVRVQKR